MLGGVTIICGLYVLLWGKAMDMKTESQSLETSSGDISKPVVLTSSLAGAMEDDKSVCSKNTLNEITVCHASASHANADEEEPDEIRMVEN